MRKPALPLYLNSASPQRFRLLQTLGVDFSLLNVPIDETPHKDEPSKKYAQRMAVNKAVAGAAHLEMKKSQRFCVIGADTCVVLRDKIFGKPDTNSEAVKMLTQLSGQTHNVLSAVAIRCSGCATVWSDICTTHVRFAHLSGQQIDEFVESGEARNRAGAYGIQGKAGEFVVRLDGSWSSVVGLPIRQTANLLNEKCLLSVNYDSAAAIAEKDFSGIPNWNGTYQI